MFPHRKDSFIGVELACRTHMIVKRLPMYVVNQRHNSAWCRRSSTMVFAVSIMFQHVVVFLIRAVYCILKFKGDEPPYLA